MFVWKWVIKYKFVMGVYLVWRLLCGFSFLLIIRLFGGDMLILGGSGNDDFVGYLWCYY